MKMAVTVASSSLLLLAGCATTPRAVEAPEASFWSALQARCGKAFEGRMTIGTDPGDADFGKERMVMQVASCKPDEIRIPFDVGANKTRTWVLTRTSTGVRLKHDHRHPDGKEDAVSQYGGDARAGGTATRQDFPADAFTANLLPKAATNVWTIEVQPQLFAYELRREEQGRRFRVEFDLTKPVERAP